MISPRENYLIALVQHKVPEWVPNLFTDAVMAGGAYETYENGPAGGGLDGFGVEWVATASAGGAPVPATGKIALDDITKWEDVVTFPDLDGYDWKQQAEIQLGKVDRSQKVIEYGCFNGQFLRLTHLMGFENALCSLFEEPEACAAFFGAVTDYKIRAVERIAEYFKPDVITTYIDVATERGLFMSPDIYCSLISPEQKRLNDAIKSYGIYPVVHNCGKCEEIIPNFIEEGYVSWSSAQPMNDIVGILKAYGDRISVVGGYDTNGRPGASDATIDEMEAEVKRCIDTYAPYGSYIFAGFRLVNSLDRNERLIARQPINDAATVYCKDFYKKGHSYE